MTIRDLETDVAQSIVSNRIHPYFAQVPKGEVVPRASEGFVYDGPLPDGYWIDAGNLKPGYRLLNPDSTWAEVVSVTERPATLDAWNLTVESAHSYFVSGREGADQVWVHNACKIESAFKKQLDLYGPKSLERSKASIEKLLREHKAKLPDLTYKSSVEREIRTYEKQLEAIDKLLGTLP